MMLHLLLAATIAVAPQAPLEQAVVPFVVNDTLTGITALANEYRNEGVEYETPLIFRNELASPRYLQLIVDPNQVIVQARVSQCFWHTADRIECIRSIHTATTQDGVEHTAVAVQAVVDYETNPVLAAIVSAERAWVDATE